ncbi:glycosyltransferase family 4 protein [bacterium]|nr:glycosyltransferase family 4 protein [bacterium]NUN46154.1 glycosyltransferase family 4 protein [bacterium]
MKLLHIISNGNIGGREKVLYILLNEESKDQRTQTSVFFKYPVGPYFKKIKSLGIPVYCDVTDLREMINLMDKQDIIVFHFVDWKFFLAGILSGKPLIYRLSGIYLLNKKSLRDVFFVLAKKIKKTIWRRRSDDGRRGDQLIKLPAKENTSQSKIPNRRSLYRLIKRKYFELFLRKWCTYLIANSRYTAKSAVEKYGIQPQKIRIVMNGIEFNNRKGDETGFRASYNIDKNVFLIGTVCRFDTRKRLDRLLMGFSMISNLKDFHLVVVGGGDTILEQTLKQFVAHNNMLDKVTFTGILENPSDAMSAMNLFVLSSDNETFGVSLVEAMYKKKPVVVFFDSGGPAEIILGQNCGYIINTPSEMPGIVEQLRADPILAQRLGESGHRLVVEKYNVKRFYKNSLRVYSELFE